MEILNTYYYSDLQVNQLKTLLRRGPSTADGFELESRVLSLLKEVRDGGDQALRRLTMELDRLSPERLYFTEEEIQVAAREVTGRQAEALDVAYSNIYRYHQAQTFSPDRVITSPGVECWRERRALSSAGLYIPGGSAVLPSTFMMLGIPARLAGVRQLTVCTPPQPSGKLNPYIAWVASKLKITRIESLGGVQAVAAMGFGTESIPAADKLFGPGNTYVTKAKQLIQNMATVAIDMPAGPSEVLVIADDTAQAEFVASDLIAQAEHGPDSQVVLASTSERLSREVKIAVLKQLEDLPRAAIARQALAKSYIIQTPGIAEAFTFSNLYAPEHLIVSVENAPDYLHLVEAAGSVFIGNYSPESAGDYASGTNHTLPTSGYARMYSGISVESFTKLISFQQISSEGLQFLGPAIIELARMEGLEGHARAVSQRTDYLNSLNG